MSAIKAPIPFGAPLRGVTVLAHSATREICESRTIKSTARPYSQRSDRDIRSVKPIHWRYENKVREIAELSRVRNRRIYVLTPGLAVWLVSVLNLHHSYSQQDSNHGETNDQEHH